MIFITHLQISACRLKIAPNGSGRPNLQLWGRYKFLTSKAVSVVLCSSQVFNLSWFPWKSLHLMPPEPLKGALLPAYRGLLYVGDLSMCHVSSAHGTIPYNSASRGAFHKHRGKNRGKFWFKSFTSFQAGCYEQFCKVGVEGKKLGKTFANSWPLRIWNPTVSLGRIHLRFDPTGKTGPSSLISIGDGWQE